jgi:hypothetical protein
MPTKHEGREGEREELLAEDAKTKREATKAQETPDREGYPGWTGPAGLVTYGKPPKRADEPGDDVVVGEGGTITLPTKISGGVDLRSSSDADRLIGFAVLEGDDFHGVHHKFTVLLTEAVTQEGAFNVFRAHVGPSAIFEGFKAEVKTEEEVRKLNEQWVKEKEEEKSPKGGKASNSKKEKE